MNAFDSKALAPDLYLRGPTPQLANFRFAAFDMDSTLIAIECIDEIAALAGKGEEVAAITEAAMRGEITDFRESLTRRLGLLAGQPEALLARVLAERLRFNPGARELCAALKAAGIKLGLVSGGFTFFTQYVAQELGMDFVRANALEVVDGNQRICKTLPKPIVRRQDAPKVYEHVASIYVLSPEYLRNGTGLLSGRTQGYDIGTAKSPDIDSEFDFEFVEYLMKKRLGLISNQTSS